MRLIRWFQRFIECWKLARAVQRGTLIVVTPYELASRTSVRTVTVYVPAPPAEAIPVIPVPRQSDVAVPTAVEDVPDAWPAVVPNAPFQVRAARPDQEPRVIAAGSEEAMKALWRQRGAVPNGTLELYDVKLNLVRGSK